MKDIQKKIHIRMAAKDAQGRLRVGAAVGVGPDSLERCEALIAEEVDRSWWIRRTGTRAW